MDYTRALESVESPRPTVHIEGVHNMKKLILSGLMLLASAGFANAEIITQWNFESDTTTPSIGAGSATLVGGTTQSFAAGSGGGRGWNTTNYAAQGTGSGQRGVGFSLSTVGFQGISMSFDHRASGTGSRWAQVDYTLDGGASWVTGFWNNNAGLSPHDTFYNFNVDFSAVSGANDNANFGVRIVSIFSPVAFDQNASLADFAANTAYMRANSQASFTPGAGIGTGDYGATGTWRFDNVTFNGSAVPEPATMALLGMVGIGGLAIRQFRRKANKNEVVAS